MSAIRSIARHPNAHGPRWRRLGSEREIQDLDANNVDFIGQRRWLLLNRGGTIELVVVGSDRRGKFAVCW